MSTEIKNTLFRFVTMRAPELLDKKVIDIRFVQHPNLNSAASSFLLAIKPSTGKSKKQALNEATAAFASNAFSTRDAVKTAVPADLYDFALWLTANRTTLTVADVTAFNATARLATDDLRIKLWDNLFYQIITFKSGYVREALISILAADFFLLHLPKATQNDKSLRKLAQARVSIPKELFGLTYLPSVSESIKAELDKLPVNTRHLYADSDRAIASARITLQENTVKELAIAKANYDKDNDLKYQVALTAHNQRVEEAYKNATFEEQIYIDPVLKVNKKYREYVDLVLPEFSYTPANELDPAVLSKALTPEALEIIENLKNNKNIKSLSEAIEAINEEVQHDYQEVFSKSNLKSRTATALSAGRSSARTGRGASNYNGTVTTLGTPVFNLTSTVVSAGQTSLLMIMDNVPAGVDVVSATYSGTINGTAVSANGNFTDQWVNDKLYVTLFTNKINVAAATTIAVNGELTLSNGDKITFNGSCNKFVYRRIFRTVTEFKGNGKYTYVPFKLTDTNGTEIKETETLIEYVPSGFGIKRLGIADYRKVEQEVCCYVPGEVSHIENVMAREYKEKASRRLSRREDTTTTSKEKENEKLTDTSTTDRFEMNQEAASVIAEDTSKSTHAGFDARYGLGDGSSIGINAAADFANNTSKEVSNSQAVTQAKEITERALDRVVQRVKEERIIKITEEFEETQKHGFDNRRGSQHVSGVYRWVDKVYRNKIINYGKRLMYEFVIPEPAAFHNAALSGNEVQIELPVAPIDPRLGDGVVQIKTHRDISEVNYNHWAAIYNAEVDPMPVKNISIGKEFAFSGCSIDNFTWSDKASLEIPDGYYTISAKVVASGMDLGVAHIGKGVSVEVGNCFFGDFNNFSGQRWSNLGVNTYSQIDRYEKSIPVSAYFCAYFSGNANATIKLERTLQAEEQWKLETFNAIIAAYEERLEEYNNKVAALKSTIIEKAKTNPMFYRQIENMSLRKNCIAYMANHANMGYRDMLDGRGTMGVRAKHNEPALEKYAAFVKFFEQAFEWDLMSYYFYPLYWAEKSQWKELYNIDNDDPLFRSFLQSSMARVVLTVRPGFEEAVNWYMATGQIWNGGQVPTINDPLFLSIVEELKDPEGIVEETWESRVPTSLTVIQAGTIGLNVQGLPCDPDCDEYKIFDEDGEVVGTVPNPIEQTDQLIGGPEVPAEEPTTTP